MRHGETVEQAPDRKAAGVVAYGDVELARHRGIVADGNGEPIAIDKKIAVRVARDEVGSECLAFRSIDAGNGGPRGIRRQLLHRMAGTKIDAISRHAHDQKNVERAEDREFDGRRGRSIGSELAKPESVELPAHAGMEARRR